MRIKSITFGQKFLFHFKYTILVSRYLYRNVFIWALGHFWSFGGRGQWLEQRSTSGIQRITPGPIKRGQLYYHTSDSFFRLLIFYLCSFRMFLLHVRQDVFVKWWQFFIGTSSSKIPAPFPENCAGCLH